MAVKRLFGPVQKGWSKFKKLVDWFDTNARYITAIWNILTSRWVLGVLFAVGILGQDATKDWKRELLGNEGTEQVELLDRVIDHAG